MLLELIAIPALLAGLYALWIVGKPDLLRLVQGTRHVRGRVSRHHEGSDGFVPVYQFRHDGRTHEAKGRTAQAKPQPPVETGVMLSYPAKRPDLARPPDHFARAIMYLGFAAWIGIFSDLLLGWW